MSYVEHCNQHGQYHGEYCGECVEATQAENARLREALERIAVAKGYDNTYGDVLGGFLMNIAREALKGN